MVLQFLGVEVATRAYPTGRIATGYLEYHDDHTTTDALEAGYNRHATKSGPLSVGLGRQTVLTFFCPGNGSPRGLDTRLANRIKRSAHDPLHGSGCQRGLSCG
jgi:hypothetical protein